MSDTPATRTTPTDKMLQYALSVSKALGEPLSDDVQGDFDACREWLDAHAQRVPASQKQIDYATQVAEGLGVVIDDDVVHSKQRLSKWLDENT